MSSIRVLVLVSMIAGCCLGSCISCSISGDKVDEAINETRQLRISIDLLAATIDARIPAKKDFEKLADKMPSAEEVERLRLQLAELNRSLIEVKETFEGSPLFGGH